MVAEFTLLEALGARVAGDRPGVPLGFGDDAAIVEIGGQAVAITVDALVEGVHVDLTLSSMADLGFKALAVNVSDLAAIGARPTAAVVALASPAGTGLEELEELYSGLLEASERWGVALVGGDVVSAPALTVAVTVVGEPPPVPLRRDAARRGHAVVVVGRLGLAAAGLACHRAGLDDVLDAHPVLLAAHRRPVPPALDAPEIGWVRACIDVSDGLGRDLGHIARASGVAIDIAEADLPIHPAVAAAADALSVDPLDLVCGGGDDYALVATGDLTSVERLVGGRDDAAIIGAVTPGEGVRVVLVDGGERPIDELGWEHDGPEAT